MPRRRIGFWYRFAAVICKPPLVVLIKRDWRGMEHIPAEGGFITAVNHNSHADPFAYAHYQYNTGRVPRFLAKSGLFRKGFVGAAMRGTGQIPVYRETTDALSAFRAAIDAVERGECVAFYPEGTLTRDPELWPMIGKTGAARVALTTRCPVIPVAQWGVNELLPPYAKKPHLLPRADRAGHRAGRGAEHVSRPVKAAVFGTGSWGTAFAMVLADAGCEVTLWGRRAELAEAVNSTRTNPDYLPGVELPDGVRATTDAAEAARGADFTVLAIPSQTLRGNLADWAPLLAPDTVLVSLMKGVELGSAMRMSEVVEDVAKVGSDRIAVVTGPNLAREIAARMPAAAVVACTDEAVARRLQASCHTPYFRPYTNTDVVGCELGGAVKNVIGLAVGIADGMGLGDNAKGSLITRGLAETTRLGMALGADPLTFSGLAGLGDLVATCSSPLSRNHTFGTNLGKGMTLQETIAVTRQTAEGVKSCESVLDLARRHGVDMPITETVVAIVHEGKSPVVAVKELMSRSAKPERR